MRRLRSHFRRYRMYWLLGAFAAGVWLVEMSFEENPSEVSGTQRRNSPMHPTGSEMRRGRLDAPQGELALLGLPSESEERPVLMPAQRDPFALLAAPVSAPIVKPPAALPIAEPVAPSAPPHNLSFAGRVTNPDGHELVYVSSGDTSLAIFPGQVLSNGYRVEAITKQAIELSYPALNTSSRIELPALPKYEIR